MSDWSHVEHPEAYEAAITRRIKANAATTRRKAFRALPDAEAIEAFLAGKEFDKPGSFLGKMDASLQEWGNLTPNQLAKVREIMAGQEAKKAEWRARDAQSQHVGKVGERITIDATVLWTTGFETQFGFCNVTGLKDAAGNQFVQKGAFIAEKGERVTGKATVKAHEERDGVKRTVIQRPKFALVPAAPAAPVDPDAAHWRAHAQGWRGDALPAAATEAVQAPKTASATPAATPVAKGSLVALAASMEAAS
jgi:hypothetical protein